MTTSSQPDPRTVTTIDPDRDVVTLINVFSLAPDNQGPFVDAQTSEYRRLAGQIEGALAANLHRGLGGTRAVNYAQFRSLQDIQRWQQSDLMKQHMPVIRPYVDRAAPGLYRAVEVASRDGALARIEAGAGRLAVIAVFSADAANADADSLLAGQREAARALVAALPSVRSLTLHRSIGGPGPHGGASGAAAVSALYAQVDSADAARALMDHAIYRAWFTTHNERIRQVDQEVYQVVYVQNEEAARQ